MHQHRRIISFLAIAFGYTWLLAGIGAFFGIRATSGLSYMALAAACMFGPALAAIVQQRLIDRGPWAGLGLQLAGTNWKMLGATALLGITIVPLILLVIHVVGDRMGIAAFGHVSVTSERVALSVADMMAQMGQGRSGGAISDVMQQMPAGLVLFAGLLSAVFSAFTFNLPFMLGEELGWRGYLYQATVSWKPQRRVLFTGVVWGLWHAPLILMGHNYPEYPIAGVGLMVVFCTLLAFLFDWSRARSGSVWSACVLHGIINGSAGLFALFVWGGHPLVASPVGVAGFTALVILAMAVFLLEAKYRGTFGHRH